MLYISFEFTIKHKALLTLPQRQVAKIPIYRAQTVAVAVFGSQFTLKLELYHQLLQHGRIGVIVMTALDSKATSEFTIPKNPKADNITTNIGTGSRLIQSPRTEYSAGEDSRPSPPPQQHASMEELLLL